MTEDQVETPPDRGEGGADRQSPGERFRDLAELEQEVRKRLRSNQRFLERFLDEDFVDDEADRDEEGDGDDEEL